MLVSYTYVYYHLLIEYAKNLIKVCDTNNANSI